MGGGGGGGSSGGKGDKYASKTYSLVFSSNNRSSEKRNEWEKNASA